MQREELELNVALAHRAHDTCVQVISEDCGGHIRTDKIAGYIKTYKAASPFPLFVAGPLPTDIATGYAHITGCTGGSLAAAAGAATSATSLPPNISACLARRRLWKASSHSGSRPISRRR